MQPARYRTGGAGRADGLIDPDLDPALVRLMAFALATYPRVFRQITRMTTGLPPDDHPRLGAWLELRAVDPAAVMRTALDAGLPEVKHPATRTTSWCPEVRSSPSRRQKSAATAQGPCRSQSARYFSQPSC
jgi:hypothetical protein